MQRLGYAAVLAALLSACGGGGGGSTANTDGSPVTPPVGLPTPDPVAAAAVTFSPAKVTAAFEAGTSSSLTVDAAVVKPADFAGAAMVYAYIVDDTGVILPSAQIVKLSDLQYRAVLLTAPSLAPGSYKGNFKLKLCRDSACASHFPGSPALLPYDFTVSKPSVSVEPPVPDPVVAGAMSFSPAKVSAAFETGTSNTMNVAATIRTPADFAGASAVYAYIVDSAGVILPDAQIFKNSDLEYSAVLRTSPSLAIGNYQGNFQIKLCRDAACASHFPGSPSLLPYNLTVTKAGPQSFGAAAAAPLDVSLHQGASTPARVAVNVSATGVTWSAKSDAAWLTLAGATGSGSGSVELRFNPANLQQGSYSAKVTVSASDGRKVELPAKLTVLPNVFVADQSGLNFSAINGAPITPQPVQFVFQSGVTGSWTAAAGAAWLKLSAAAGVTPGGTTVTVNPAIGPLASGTHTSQLTLNSPLAGAAGKVAVKLTLTKPTLSMSSSSVTLGGALGRSFVDKGVMMHLNTAGNAWPWTLSAAPAWASASKVSGTVSQAGAPLTFTANAALAPVGSTTVVLGATAKVNGDTVTAPLALTINKDQRKVLASETGVALVSTPGWSRLSRTLKVSDNFAQNGSWTASSNQAWLSVTASGVSGGNLVLSANPAALPQNTISYATITLGSTDASISAPEPVRVALWKGSATPSAITKIGQSYTNVIADPIRPLIYAHNQGALIDVFNVYTAQKTSTVTVGGATLGELAISPNGDHLYVVDSGHEKLQVISLSNLSVATSWLFSSSLGSYTQIKAIRPNGVEILLRNDGSAHLAATGKLLSGGGISGGVITASADGKRVYVQDEGFSPASLNGFNVDYSAISGGTLVVKSLADAQWGDSGSNGRDVAVSPDGSRLYGASGSPYKCRQMNPVNLSFIKYLPGGEHYPNNVEVGSDGRVFCGISGWYADSDIWVHRADGSLQSSFKVAGYAKEILARQMVVSGDGLIMVTLTSDPLLAIIPVGP